MIFSTFKLGKGFNFSLFIKLKVELQLSLLWSKLKCATFLQYNLQSQTKTSAPHLQMEPKLLFNWCLNSTIQFFQIFSWNSSFQCTAYHHQWKKIIILYYKTNAMFLKMFLFRVIHIHYLHLQWSECMAILGRFYNWTYRFSRECCKLCSAHRVGPVLVCKLRPFNKAHY